MIKALLFDLNGTVIDILTNEADDNVFRTTANFLSYFGVYISKNELKEEFFNLNRKQRKSSREEFPEFDSAKIFEDIICHAAGELTGDIKELSRTASRVFRAASRYKLELYDGVFETLLQLKHSYRMAAVSDGQSLWAVPELTASGISDFFDFVLVSGDFGFRKPDKRIFDTAAEKTAVAREEILFVGNDMYRDIYGAKKAGLKTVFFKSNQGEQRYCGAEPDYIIYEFPQLVEAISFFERQS